MNNTHKHFEINRAFSQLFVRIFFNCVWVLDVWFEPILSLDRRSNLAEQK